MFSLSKYVKRIVKENAVRAAATICEWIDSRVTGGYIHGVARLGKSRAVKFWVEARLSEKYHGRLPFFRFIYQRYKHYSEIEFLLALLEASRHRYGKSDSRKTIMDRLVRLYATRAKNACGNHVVLMIAAATLPATTGKAHYT